MCYGDTQAIKVIVHREDKEKKQEKKARLKAAIASKTPEQQSLSRAILAYGGGSNYFKFTGDNATAKLRAEAKEAGTQLKSLGGRTIRRKKSERVKRTVYHGKKQKEPEESSSMDVEKTVKPRRKALTKRRKAK